MRYFSSTIKTFEVYTILQKFIDLVQFLAPLDSFMEFAVIILYVLVAIFLVDILHG